MERLFSVKQSTQLKGLAILIMMFHHSYASVDRFANYNISFAPFAQDSVVAISFYSKICVSLFAFVTGYGLYLAIKRLNKEGLEISRWVLKRLVKLLGGFFFVYILAFIFCQVYAGLPGKIYFEEGYCRGIGFILLDALGLTGLTATPMLNPTWWYMSAAIVYIVFVPIAYVASKRVGLLPILITVIVLPRVLKSGYTGGINPYTFLVPVLLGMICAECDVFRIIGEWESKRSRVCKALVFCVWCCTVCAGVYFCTRFPHDIIWEVHYGFMPLLIIVFVWKYLLWLPGFNHLFMILGKYSMTIFLTHTFIRYHFCADFIYGFHYFWLVVIVLTACSLALAVMIDTVKNLLKWDRLVYHLMKKIDKRYDSL